MKRLVTRIGSAVDHPAFLGVFGWGILGLVAVLILEHIHAVDQVQNVSIPLLSELPQLERKLSVVEQQVELSQLHAATSIGSQDETIELHVLPHEFNIERLLGFFDVFTTVVTDTNHVSNVSAVELGGTYERGEYSVLPIEFSASVDTQGLQDVVHILELSGNVTVADVLTPEERSLLLERTEQENPAGIVELESFLSRDLALYCKEPQVYERSLRRSFTGPAFTSAIESIFSTSQLSSVCTHVAGRLGIALQEQNLWPVPLLSIEEVTLTQGGHPDWYRADIQLHTYSRLSE